MEVVLAAPLMIWLWGGLLIATPYFWFTRTTPAMSPIERRVRAMGLGLAWPVIAWQAYARKKDASTPTASSNAASQRILGD